MLNNKIMPGDEEILFPGLPICDPHQHFFNFPDFQYTPDDLMKDITTGHKVVQTVYIDCKTGYRENGPDDLKPVGETEYVENLVSNYINPQQIKIAAGIVGFADLKLGDSVKPVLEAHMAASPKRFRGVRNVAAWDISPAFSIGCNAPHAGLLLDSAFRKGFAYLKKFKLSFDAMVFHTQLPDLIDLAGAFPDTTIILNHIGLPLGIGPYADKQNEVFSNWKKGIAELSTCKNVFIKIGGFGMDICAYGLNNLSKPISSFELYEIIKPYCLWCIEKFDVDRCMFESNFPIDKRLLSYVVLWNAFKRITGDFSPNERQKLFHDTAVKVYGI
jgi:L-fuconolactonase